MGEKEGEKLFSFSVTIFYGRLNPMIFSANFQHFYTRPEKKWEKKVKGLDKWENGVRDELLRISIETKFKKKKNLLLIMRTGIVLSFLESFVRKIKANSLAFFNCGSLIT